MADKAGLVEKFAHTLWRYHCVNHEARSTDLIVGLGGYDLHVVEQCADLFVKGLAPSILFSGNRSHWTMSLFKEPEAVVFAQRARALGVPPDKILVEVESSNLGENLTFTRQLLMRDSIKVRSVTFVAKGNTLRRVQATASVVWPKVNSVLQCPRAEWTDQPCPGISKNGLINEMVGDIHRILVYPDLGFQSAQVVPPKVFEAYQQLIRLGFDKHLVPGYAPEPLLGPR